MMFETFDWKIVSDIGHLMFVKPPKNEMDKFFFNELSSLVSMIDDQLPLKGLIIFSEGRHFSSGANIQELLTIFDHNSDLVPANIEKNKNTFLRFSKLPYPVIAILKGVCLGAALELALCAHFRISSKNIVLSLPETSFDLIPGLGGIRNLTNLIGESKALEYVLTGNSIDSETAVELGIIDEVTEKEKLVSNAKGLIEFINGFSTYDPHLRNYYLAKYQNINVKYSS